MDYIISLQQTADFLKSSDLANKYGPYLKEFLPAGSINTRAEVVDYMAQTAYESAGYTRMVESLNYTTTSRLVEIFKKYIKDEKTAKAYLHNPEKLANLVYANRMGNGSVDSGDGYRFRGRSPIHLTGRSLYTIFGVRIYGDGKKFTEGAGPDLIAGPEYGTRAAVWYWTWRGLNSYSQTGDYKGLTKAINGGLNGYDDYDRSDLDSRIDWKIRAEKIFI
jgi:putative chitinase